MPFLDPLDAMLSSFAFFNFDLAVLGLACVKIDYRTMWVTQTLLLPLVYPACCTVHFLWMVMVAQFAKSRRAARVLFKFGWKPRRWSWRTLHHTYLPAAMDYLHMYYLTGVAKSFEMFKCLGGEGGEPPYLQADPSMLCWQDDHLTLIPFAAMSTLVYLVGVPCMYSYVLFSLVPKRGLHDTVLNADYGFIWKRHEEKYYWWEVRTHP